MRECYIVVDKKTMDKVNVVLSGIKNGMEKAVSRAINRTATSTNVLASKLIKKEYTIKNGTKGYITKAGINGLAANIDFAGRPRLHPNFSMGITKKGISVRIKKTSRRTVIPRTFIIPKLNISNAPGVAQREEGAPRYPINVLHGPALPQMVGNVNVQPKVVEYIQKRLDERLEHEIDAILKGHAK